MAIRNYKDLEVWNLARELVGLVYKYTAVFPKEELYGLTNQARRSSISIPSNIAEGHSRNGTKEYINYISISIGSLAELETQLIIAQDLKYLDQKYGKVIFERIELLQRKLHSLRNSLRKSLIPNP